MQDRFVTKKHVLLFGKTLNRQLAKHATKPIGVYVEADQLVFNAYTSITAANKALDRFLQSTARAYIEPRTNQLAAKMKTNFNQLRFKEQKTRWGSCSSKRNLNFNWRLVHAPPEVIDYVIIHELAHLTHMDHSSRFWSLVAQYDPEHARHSGWLKRQGVAAG